MTSKDEKIVELNAYVINVSRPIGTGAFSKVYLGRQRKTNRILAFKIMRRDKMVEMTGERIQREVGLFEDLQRDREAFKKAHIVEFIEKIEQDGHLILVFQFCNYGSLGQLIRDRGPMLCEDEIRHYLRHVFKALQFLHSKGIMHRDLKSTNILLHNTAPELVYDYRKISSKLSDFDFARVIDNDMSQTICGSPIAFAPEMLSSLLDKDNKKGIVYDLPSEIWALGILLFEMRFGKLPFANECKNIVMLSNLLQNGAIPFPTTTKPSDELDNLMKSMLQIDPAKRITWHAFENHPFMTGHKFKVPNKPLSLDQRTSQMLEQEDEIKTPPTKSPMSDNASYLIENFYNQTDISQSTIERSTPIQIPPKFIEQSSPFPTSSPFCRDSLSQHGEYIHVNTYNQSPSFLGEIPTIPSFNRYVTDSISQLKSSLQQSISSSLSSLQK